MAVWVNIKLRSKHRAMRPSKVKTKMRTSSMQQYIRELLKEEGKESSSEEDKGQPGREESKAPAKRGRPKIPERWTRVISVHSDDLSTLRTYELGPELLLDQSLGASQENRGEAQDWRPLYWPPHIKKQQLDFKVENNVLRQDQLK
jgi:hypothetical protein